MFKALKVLIALPFIALLLVTSACTPTTADKLSYQENQVDADGLPILTQEQENAGIVCKREPVTGTRISKKVCTTKEQRELAQQRAQDELRNTQRTAAGPTISE